MVGGEANNKLREMLSGKRQISQKDFSQMHYGIREIFLNQGKPNQGHFNLWVSRIEPFGFIKLLLGCKNSLRRGLEIQVESTQSEPSFDPIRQRCHCSAE